VASIRASIFGWVGTLQADAYAASMVSTMPSAPPDHRSGVWAHGANSLAGRSEQVPLAIEAVHRIDEISPSSHFVCTDQWPRQSALRSEIT